MDAQWIDRLRTHFLNAGGNYELPMSQVSTIAPPPVVEIAVKEGYLTLHGATEIDNDKQTLVVIGPADDWVRATEKLWMALPDSTVGNVAERKREFRDPHHCPKCEKRMKNDGRKTLKDGTVVNYWRCLNKNCSFKSYPEELGSAK